MVTSLKDDDGKIICFVEWRLVGQSGYDSTCGEYIFVNELWVHRNHRNKGRIARIIDEIMRTVPSARYCYFKREKYGGRMKIFSREYWERRRSAYEKVGV